MVSRLLRVKKNQLSEQKFNDYIIQVFKLAGIITPMKDHKAA